MPNRLNRLSSNIWAIISLAAKKFSRIEGTQRAGAFAFNVFLALFPLLLLLVTIVSFFVDQNQAGQEVVSYIEGYVPISAEMKNHIFGSITGVIKSRGGASIVALTILVWVALQCYTTMILAINRAWGGTEGYKWWRLPLKSLMLLCLTVITFFLGMVAQVLAKTMKEWFLPLNEFHSLLFTLGGIAIPLVVIFFSLSLFYWLAPHRKTRISEVWGAAMAATALMQGAEVLFLIYIQNFTEVNPIYGIFGGIIALLVWIYLTGIIFIFGACLSAAQAECCPTPAASEFRGHHT